MAQKPPIFLRGTESKRKYMAENPRLSPMEYLLVGGAVIKALIAVIIATLTGLFRGDSGASTYGKHIIYAGMRTIMRSITIRQFQALNPTTRSVYTDFAKKQGLPIVEADLGDGIFGFWLGDKNAKTVLLWLHGGGYVCTASPGYMQLMWNLVVAAEAKGVELAVFFLEYRMCPMAQYPEQLKQATSALQYVTETESRSPSSVLLGGDSAGGNLALALLSHISHPQPAINPCRLYEDLRGAIILSPWVTFDQDSVSMQKNSKKDLLDTVALKIWSDAFTGNAKKDPYNDPKSAPDSWWKNLKVKDLCLTAGRDELFIDDIEELARTIKIHKPSLETFVAQGEAHDEALMGYVLGSPGGQSECFFREWVLERCSPQS